MRTGTVASSNTRIIQMDSLVSVSMGSTALSITNIPQNYNSLILVGSATLSTNISGFIESYPGMRFNDDASSNYSRTLFVVNASNSQNNTTAMDYSVQGPSGTPSPRRNYYVIYIPEYNNTSKHKSAIFQSARMLSDGSSGRNLERGIYAWRSTAAINKITLTTGISGGSPTGTFLTSGQIILYGLREE
jgi:hypothetical protein